MGRSHTIEKQQEVLSLYKQGVEIKEILRITGVSKDIPTKLAQKAGISRGSGIKSSMPLSKFKLGTPSSNYWIGYIISDGNISDSGRSNNIMICSIDNEIKEKYLAYSNANYYLRNNYLHTMYFCSKEIAKYLFSIGITPRKSLTIDPKFALDNHILRGIFDGDGCVHNKRTTCKITTASPKLGELIVGYLASQNIYSKLRKRIGTNCYDVNIERREDYKRFFTLLYKNSHRNIQMDRKYNKFVTLLSNK